MTAGLSDAHEDGAATPAPAPASGPLRGAGALRTRALDLLDRLASRSRLRRLDPLGDLSADALDLTHNDYLGLRDDPETQAAALAAARSLPHGAGASRLLGGEHAVFGELEAAFAAFKAAPAALFFPSGYAANEAVLPALATLFGPRELRIFSDSLNHASLIDGIRLTGLPNTQRVIYKHNDLKALAAALRASDAEVNVIVTESLFSMDGDVADLRGLLRLARAHRGVLVIDEAHASFCLGPEGRGLVPALEALPGESLWDDVITIDTCGKAFGAQGAFVSGPQWLRDLLINTARTFIYTTAPSPWTAAALLATLQRSPLLEPRRARLAAIGGTVRDTLVAAGFDIGPTVSHIVPVLCGGDARAIDWANALRAAGIRVKPIRPPTVPEGTSRLRLSLHAGLSDAQVDRLCAAMIGLARHD
jgi:8-amino-7-oxononanoate synthase